MCELVYGRLYGEVGVLVGLPNIPVTRSSMPSLEEYTEEIAPLWESRWLTNAGAKHQELQHELEDYLTVDHVCLFTNGHLALEAALEALKLGEDGRNEVITTPFTFASTTNAIIRRGLIPVMADVKPDDCTIDPEKVEALITERTCAIVPVHVYGNICDNEALETIARKRDLKLVYDAAHAFGVRPATGKPVAAMGDASMFSFHATKVFNTVEGGAVTFNGQEDYLTALEQRRNFGLAGEDALYVGGNAKMSEFHAAMGVCNLRHVEAEIAKRNAADDRYRERLSGIKGIRLLAGNQPGIRWNRAYQPVLIEPAVFGSTRDEVFDSLNTVGILSRKYFYPATNAFSCHDGMLDPSATPIASHLAQNVLCLPMYADLTKHDVDRVCDALLACIQ